MSRRIGIAALAVSSVPALAIAATPPKIVPPNQKVAQTPVIQFKAQNPPVMPKPLAGHPTIATVFAIQSFSSSQNTPTSPPPGIAPCLSNGACSQAAGCVNTPTWPTVAQSIAWWKGQNQNLKGTYKYHVGITYSHQDAEGWINQCAFTPKPTCPDKPGYGANQSYWSYPNWVKDCPYTSQPSCSAKGKGWAGSYSWNAATKSWTGDCYYVSPPPCQNGAGWFDSYSWNGSSWVGSCTYVSKPTCPAHYSCSYTWVPSWSGGPRWVEHTTPDACPTGAGWSGSSYPNCNYQSQPSCQKGWTGSYSWDGSTHSWISHCSAPAGPPVIKYYVLLAFGLSGFGMGGGPLPGPFYSAHPYCNTAPQWQVTNLIPPSEHKGIFPGAYIAICQP